MAENNTDNKAVTANAELAEGTVQRVFGSEDGKAYYQMLLLVTVPRKEYHKIDGAGTWKVSLTPDDT
jgi:hypothetical protein